MSTISVFEANTPTSNEVADVISVLDHESPSAYSIQWEGVDETPDKTYDVEEFHLGASARILLEGNRIIDANPSGRPRVIYANPSDGYERKQRLVDLKILTTQFHWRHQIQFIARELQERLGLIGTGVL